jgi:hypothetical protein
MRSKLKGVTALTACLTLMISDVASAGNPGGNKFNSTFLSQTDGKDDSGTTQQQPQRGNGLCGALGVVAGLIAGVLFGGRRNGGFNPAAGLVAGLATGVVCHAVRWRSVHRRDQDEVNRRVAAMTVDPSQNAQTYTSAVTGTTYQISAEATTYQAGNVEITTIEEVEAPQQGSKLVTTPLRVTSEALNLRASPGTAANDVVTGSFRQGNIVEGLSETPDGQWVLLAYQGIGYGYVSRRFLEPVYGSRENLTYAEPGPPIVIPPPAPPRRPQARRGARGRAAAPPPRPQPAPMIAAPAMAARTGPPRTRVQTVSAQMPCRNITVAAARSDRHQACSGPRGAVAMS